MRLTSLYLPKFFLFVFALLIGIGSFSSYLSAQTPRTKGALEQAQDLEQEGEQTLKNDPNKKTEAAGKFDKAAEKYLEALQSKFLSLKTKWEAMKKALEMLRKAANLYQQCGNGFAKQLNKEADELERQLFQFETAHAHSLPLPKTDRSHLPPVNPVPAPEPEPKEEKAKTETKKPTAPKAQGRTGRVDRGGRGGNRDEVKPPPAPQKPECDKDDKPIRKVIFKKIYQVPHPTLEVKIKTKDATGRGEYGKGVAIMGDFFNGMGDVIGAGQKIVQKVPGGGLVAGLPMRYFETVLKTGGAIVDKAEAIQKGGKYTLVDLYIEIPYKEYKLICVEIYQCENGKWVLADTKMKEVETEKSKTGKTKKVFNKPNNMSNVIASEAAKKVAKIVPREVKALVENQKAFEAKKKAGCN